MKISEHPFWFAGFRPFFTFACLSGMALPVLWTLAFSGALAPPAMRFSAMQWHAHEMFFGFGWAMLGGFLLTATKNWVGIRGYHGKALMLLAAAWLIERAAMWFSGSLPPLLFDIANNLFLTAIVAMLLWTLLRYRKNDSYRADNLFFLLALPLFPLAKNLLLSEQHYAVGLAMTLGLFRLAFLLMLERTLSQFMKNVFQADVLRLSWLDLSIKLLALTLVGEALLPRTLAAALSMLLALLLLLRLIFWKPQLALRRLEIGIMYLGYLALSAQLLLDSAAALFPIVWVGSLSVHVFTFGVVGLITPAMLVRICKGHTGRKVIFDAGDKLALWIMMAAFLLRIVAPQLLPALYMRWIELSAACWFACFALLGWRYIPFLLSPRVDGKEH